MGVMIVGESGPDPAFPNAPKLCPPDLPKGMGVDWKSPSSKSGIVICNTPSGLMIGCKSSVTVIVMGSESS